MIDYEAAAVAAYQAVTGEVLEEPALEAWLAVGRAAVDAALVDAEKVWWCVVGKKRMPGAEHRTVSCQMRVVQDGTHSSCGWYALVGPLEEEER